MSAPAHAHLKFYSLTVFLMKHALKNQSRLHEAVSTYEFNICLTVHH
jgi:hypothetical protein